jgi:hypothetical protein
MLFLHSYYCHLTCPPVFSKPFTFVTINLLFFKADEKISCQKFHFIRLIRVLIWISPTWTNKILSSQFNSQLMTICATTHADLNFDNCYGSSQKWLKNKHLSQHWPKFAKQTVHFRTFLFFDRVVLRLVRELVFEKHYVYHSRIIYLVCQKGFYIKDKLRLF